MYPDEVRTLKTQTLQSKEAGRSGADWIGATPQEGLVHPNGQIPDTVMGQLVALYRRERTIPDATETQKGGVELATAAEIEAGAAGLLVATTARLKAELDRRDALKSQMGALDAGPEVFSNITVGSTIIHSADLRGVGGIPTDAKGVYVTLYAPTQSSPSHVGVGSGDAAPTESSRFVGQVGGPNSVNHPVALGTGGSAGKIAVRLLAGSDCTGFYAYVNGWWR